MVAVKEKTGTWKRSPEQKRKLKEHILKVGINFRFIIEVIGKNIFGGYNRFI